MKKEKTSREKVDVDNFVSQNRIGLFIIPKYVIEQRPEIVLEFMKQVVIVRAEMMLHKNAVEYYAYSPLFEPVEPGAVLFSYLMEYDSTTKEIKAHKQG